MIFSQPCYELAERDGANVEDASRFAPYDEDVTAAVRDEPAQRVSHLL